MKHFQFQKLSKQEEDQVEIERNIIYEKLSNVPKEGIEVKYLDKKFTTLNSVFWPREDSKEIVRKMTIKPGDEALDVCTGSGVIAVYAAERGAKKVVALDINPEAVRNVKINAEKFGFDKVIAARVSDVFSGLNEGEKFDVITCNPPFSNKKISGKFKEYIEQTIKDEGFVLHQKLFEGFDKFLKPGGRIFLSDANFGNIENTLELANKYNFNCQLVGTNKVSGTVLIFYAFELTRK